MAAGSKRSSKRPRPGALAVHKNFPRHAIPTGNDMMPGASFDDVDGGAVDFRLVAATSRNLSELMAKGEFHEDLYYRLQVFTLEVPSLRERPIDIQPLAAHFLAKHSDGCARLSEGALDALASHAWPGNVRELENSIQRALVPCTRQTSLF